MRTVLEAPQANHGLLWIGSESKGRTMSVGAQSSALSLQIFHMAACTLEGHQIACHIRNEHAD